MLPKPCNNSLLVVDDEEYLLEILTSHCSKYVANVFAAKNGQEALAVQRKNQIDIVILDLNMPIMGGIECFAAMKEMCPDCIGIVVTAFADQEVVRTALRLGIYDFLYKPVDEGLLQMTLARACELADLIKERKTVLEALLFEYLAISGDCFEKLSVAEKAETFKALRSLVEVRLLRKKISA